MSVNGAANQFFAAEEALWKEFGLDPRPYPVDDCRDFPWTENGWEVVWGLTTAWSIYKGLGVIGRVENQDPPRANAVPMLQHKARSRISLLFGMDEEVYEECPNDPLKNVRIFTLEFRGEGGRAYKVVTEDGYCYDFREDVLVEAMIEAGITKGGILNGEYVWAVVGSQMKLVRVGSHLYNILKKRTKAKAKKKISIRDYELGGVYETASGNQWIFCGFCHTRKNSKKMQLWIEVRHWMSDGDKTAAEAAMEGLSHYNFEIKSSCAVVSRVGTVDLGPDIFQRCRDMNAETAVERFRERVGYHERYRGSIFSRGAAAPTWGDEDYYVEKYTATPYGDDIITSPLVAEYER